LDRCRNSGINAKMSSAIPPVDIALGNEGAPITVAAMARLFGHAAESRLISMCGMATTSIFRREEQFVGIRAADTGPGNAVADLLCPVCLTGNLIATAHFASRGMVSRALLHSH